MKGYDIFSCSYFKCRIPLVLISVFLPIPLRNFSIFLAKNLLTQISIFRSLFSLHFRASFTMLAAVSLHLVAFGSYIFFCAFRSQAQACHLHLFLKFLQIYSSSNLRIVYSVLISFTYFCCLKMKMISMTLMN